MRPAPMICIFGLWALLSLPMTAMADSRGFPGPQAPLHGNNFLLGGLGPIGGQKNAGYVRGLLACAWAVLGAGPALALESAQALALLPARMVRLAAAGEATFFLEPARTIKNLFWDAVCAFVGLINSASGPVWNALRPDEPVDFAYARHRLIFYGGPLAGLIKDTRYARAMAPSWHVVFVTQEFGRPWLEHEFVHNYQIGRSLLAERVGEDYKGFAKWRRDDARRNLNW